MKRHVVLSLLAGITMAGIGCDAMTAHTGVLARVGERELTVDETVDLMAGNAQIPARTEVMSTIADLWIDYTILAQLAAEDSTLAGLDLGPMLEPYVEQQLFAQLRDQVITTDTVFTREELQALYEEEAPGARVRARHILLSTPGGASDAVHDSVRELASELRERAVAGEDFGALAREHSDDPGTSQQGGDLGWFGRGEMVGPFEQAAFGLEPGEISDVVQTPYGLHIIRLEERQRPSADTATESFRRQVVNRRQQTSVDDYVSALREDRAFEVRSGAQDVVRDLAEDPARPLRGRAATRELVTWRDGALTVRELAATFRRMPPQQRRQFVGMGDEELANVLEQVSTNELVLADARTRGLSVPQEEQDSIRDVIRTQLTDLVQNVGLAGTPQEGETAAEAVDRRVTALLERILAGQANVLPLGSLGYALRDGRDWQVNEAAFAEAVDRLNQRRTGATGGAAPPAGQAPPMPPVEPGDTGG